MTSTVHSLGANNPNSEVTTFHNPKCAFGTSFSSVVPWAEKVKVVLGMNVPVISMELW